MVRKFNKIIASFIAVIFMFCTSFTVSAADGYKDWTQGDSRWGNKTLGSCGGNRMCSYFNCNFSCSFRFKE